MGRAKRGVQQAVATPVRGQATLHRLQTSARTALHSLTKQFESNPEAFTENVSQEDFFLIEELAKAR